jgi:hypothetical protein
MKKRLFVSAVICLAAFVSVPSAGQVTERVVTKGFTGHYIGPLQGRLKRYQGMDVWKNWIFSCEDSGVGTLYAFNGRTLERKSQFELASADKVNHCNVVSFGVEKAVKGDPFPVAYISQCHRKRWNGLKDVLFVERIRPDMQGSELVQTIVFDDRDGLFGYGLQWVVDRENKMLYGYGNTTQDKDLKGNRHRIVKFRLPRLADSDKDGRVILTGKDLLENYLIEESGYRFATIGQGLFIRKGMLYMPVGLGNEKYPSYLLCWNLRTRQMDRVLDLGRCTFGELEDAGYHRGRLVVQGQKGIFTLKLH